MSSPSTVDQWVKFSSTTVGRDKVNRGVQFFTRFLVWHLSRQTEAPRELIEKLVKFQSAVGLSRKFQRLGRPLDFAVSAQKALSNADDTQKTLMVSKALGMAIYLSFDTLQYLHMVGLRPLAKEDVKVISDRGNKFWLFAILSSFILDLYKLSQNAAALEKAQKDMILLAGRDDAKDDPAIRVRTLKSQRKELMLTTLQDLLDMAIPATALNYLQFSNGVIGLIGVFTSILGARSHWKSLAGGK